MTDETPTDEFTPAVPTPPNREQRPAQDAVAEQAAPAAPAPQSAPGRRERFLSGEDLAPPGRRIKLPAMLFLATCVTTFWAGCKDWRADFVFLDFNSVQTHIAASWDRGLVYMLAVMAILLAHEMGHFVQTVRRDHIPASWPFFIPILGVPTGTMGAVIGLDGSRANRKEMFDMGISGPLAGLVVAVPMACFAIANMDVAPLNPSKLEFGHPLFFRIIIGWFHGAIESNQTLVGSPLIQALYTAAWVGMLVTGLNMLPIGQLDGGHVAYCMFGERAHTLARGLLLFSIAYMLTSGNDNWILMIVLVIFIGTDHPPTHDDRAPMGAVRYAIGIASLTIPIFCFMPNPFR